MSKKGRTVVVAATVLTTVFGLSGCSPSAQPPLNNQPTGTGVLSSNGWQKIYAAVQLGEQAKMYKVKSTVSVAQGPLHSNLSVYGSINEPDRAYVSFTEDNKMVQFYQQGQAAYEMGPSGWSQATPINDLNLYTSYAQLLSRGVHSTVPIYQLPKAYVVDEYCNVYTANIPEQWLNSLPMWQNRIPANRSDPGNEVQFVFYVGQKDGELREVQTSSVGSVSEAGPLVVNTDTILFSINSPLAKIQLPPNLIKAMETP
ncbi:hypothetical protein LLE49_08315 [Alicyclobacillus tolerans]|uniref:hypothetical protein n=1 Tax=Alicyclobacillus tolerans TaxID=90970 RepID=UPI001F464E92|nr:hypothetical protein [Alicyclobacillus tolerans]MCF8564730.1 hypothetical protein [Alicyclobacillus tolerans]